MGIASAFKLSAVISKLPGFLEVEKLARSKFASEVELMTEIPDYLFSIGGKRIRPALALLCAQALGIKHPPHGLIEVSAGIELIHLATLLHDDIIDKSPKRRHQESPYVRYGTENTLLSGDFLLVRAFSLCAHLDPRIIDETERACIDLVEGEMLEVPLHRAHQNMDGSLRIARKKTAALFRLAGFCGAFFAVTPNESKHPSVEYFANFAEKLGVAFQILDDILDVTADESLLGKKSGLDLLERKPSIVNVLWLASGSRLAQHLLEAPGAQADEEAFCQTALDELRASSTIKEARNLAEKYINDAENDLLEAVRQAPHSDENFVKTLRALLAYSLERGT